MVEGARLESVYTFKAYRGFESPSVRQDTSPWFLGTKGFFILVIRLACLIIKIGNPKGLMLTPSLFTAENLAHRPMKN